MEEDVGDTDVLQGYQWLLRDLPRLPLFDSVRSTTALALQQVRALTRAAVGGDERATALPRCCSDHPPLQAIHMETDPQTISAYLIYLSQHTPVEEQAQHSDLALVRQQSQPAEWPWGGDGGSTETPPWGGYGASGAVPWAGGFLGLREALRVGGLSRLLCWGLCDPVATCVSSLVTTHSLEPFSLVPEGAKSQG